MALCPWQPDIFVGSADHNGVGGTLGPVIGAGDLLCCGSNEREYR
jgi:hypothetical protein